MTHHLDIEPILDSWLSEGTDVLPDRSVEAVLRTVERTAQRRALRTPWRIPIMNGFPRLAVVASTTVIVVLVAGGLIYLGGRTPGIGSPTPSSAPTPVPSPTSSPVVSPEPSPPLGLAIVGLDGTVRQDLGLPRDAWAADLSADGSQVVFSTADQSVGFCGGCVDGIRRPAVVDVGARQGMFIYPSSGPDGEPIVETRTFTEFAWSPDGEHIAVQGTDSAGNRDIYVVDLDPSQAPIIGGTVRRLTTDPADDEFPTWTPDGSTILYSNLGATPPDDSGFSPTQEIWSVPAAGGKPRRLTHNRDRFDTMPDVSANGTVAYWAGGEIRAMDIDGSHDRTLIQVPPSVAWFNPRWSPDGAKIALLEYDDSKRGSFPIGLGLPTDVPLLRVVVVDVATGDTTEVGPRVAADWNPVSWTPDGTALLIDRYDDGGAAP